MGPLTVCLIRMNHATDGSALAESINVVALKCTIEGGESDIPIEVLDAEFFDDQILIIVYRAFDREHGACCEIETPLNCIARIFAN